MNLGAQAVIPMRPTLKPANYPRKRDMPAVVTKQSKYPLPYFAHQQLDTAYFPRDIGLPVGRPKVENGENAVWDDDDSDNGADLESDAGEASHPSKTRRKPDFIGNDFKASDVKNMKIRGGRPAIAKKVSADLDSDDELIVRMKEARFLEKDIAQALVDQGRIAYNPKTIGTRWRRIKAKLQKRQDDLLDADLTDWHDGDDDILLQAVIKADAEVDRLKAEIDGRKWRMVADSMKNMKPVVNFSQNACRSRYDALMAGNAKPTPESIPNPTPEILERIQSRLDKEARLARDQQQPNGQQQTNIAGNAWSSRQRHYF
ncbi:hypothetical protein PV08_11894 [Exophiala spinifera]|uniref:DUF7626 domain-containing protein n=1 Tax=Exophiala spinifera TaxID=91928 RepID=A0A0D2BEH0_9EURO|nr:uncharacterized protein PV08_11894 [Exophiala spinifera]KIW09794.1 hypothetical protein PV08_11894 [Exophiala spinifera]